MILLYDATDATCRVLIACKVIPSLHSAVGDGWRMYIGLPGTQHDLVAYCESVSLELR